MIFCLNLFSFQNRLFPEFLFSRISASVPFFANSQFFAEFANLVRFLRRSAKKVPVLDPEEIISDMTRAQWFKPDSHMSTKKSHELSHDQWKAYQTTIFRNRIFVLSKNFLNWVIKNSLIWKIQILVEFLWWARFARFLMIFPGAKLPMNFKVLILK